VAINRSKTTGVAQYDLSVQVTQKRAAPLEALKAEHGGSISPTKTPLGCWRWRLAGSKAEIFLRRIQPFALVKATEIQIALRFRATTGKTGNRLPVGVTQLREEMRQAISAAKRAI
jgi:hypothetical protein